jgi:hypothetical protein
MPSRRAVRGRDRDPGHLPLSVIEQNDPGFSPGDFPTAFRVVQAIEEIAAVAVPVSGGDFGVQPIAVEAFGSIDDHGVGDDESETAHVQFGKATVGQKPDAGFVHEAQNGVVADVAAIIDIADLDLDFGGKGEGFRKFESYASHGRRFSFGWRVEGRRGMFA